MRLLYNTGINIYHFFIWLGSITGNKKAKKWVEGRRDIFTRLEKEISSGERIAWFHCASLGEFEQGRTVLEKYKTQNPETKILLTFFSPSGYEVRKDYPSADYISYLPIDTRKNAKRFISVVQPDVVFFVKYEFWYHYIKELKKREIPLYIISAVFREDQIYFRGFGHWFLKILKSPTHIFVQNHKSHELLKKYGVDNTTVAGDTRFDRVTEIMRNKNELPLIEAFSREKMTLVCGSTWQEDEAILTRAINSEKFNLKYIIAPHVINREDIEDLAEGLKPKTLLYSQATDENIEEAEVLIIDSIGFLFHIYGYGHLAYVGGGFGAGIHNVLEPAAFGLPVMIGPEFEKFPEAVDLIVKGGAFEVSNYDDFEKCLRFLLFDPNVYKIACEVARGYVAENTGATDRILEKV